MKIVWLINIVMPELAEELGMWKTSLGGWLVGQMHGIKQTDTQLSVLTVSEEIREEIRRTIDGVDYYVLPHRDRAQLCAAFRRVLTEIDPDVFHIFGTESEAADIASEVADPRKTVVSIQGLVSVYATHIVSGIPERVVASTVWKKLGKKLLHGSIIADDVTRLSSNGERECRILKRAQHIIGRTSWDKACTHQINPKATYHVCREILRDSFYEGQWSPDTCERHSIFLSQSSSPVKGLHQVLKALPLVLREYPDTTVYLAGAPFTDFPKRGALKQKMVEYFCGYQGYIERLVRENDLYGKLHFLNYLDENRMKAQYLRANVFVMPSSIENSPNSLGEAMILGVPSVASCVGGVQDMLKAPEEGFVYPFDAPYMLAYDICRIFASDDLALSFSQQARRHALQTHDREQNTKDLLNIYKEMLS